MCPNPTTTSTTTPSPRMDHTLDLNKVNLLQGLDDATRSSILQCLECHEYAPGDLVFEQNSTGRSVYFLEDGVVDVVVDGDIVVDQIQEGSVFGELALLLQMPRTATIRAATPCIAYELQRPAFEAAAQGSPVLKQRLRAVKDERWTRFRKDLEAAVLHPEQLEPKQKAYLLEVFKQIDADGSGAIDVQELAVMLERLAGHSFPPAHVQAMMETLDKDGNGTIEAEEFLAGLPLLAQWLVDVDDIANHHHPAPAPAPAQPKEKPHRIHSGNPAAKKKKKRFSSAADKSNNGTWLQQTWQKMRGTRTSSSKAQQVAAPSG